MVSVEIVLVLVGAVIVCVCVVVVDDRVVVVVNCVGIYRYTGTSMCTCLYISVLSVR